MKASSNLETNKQTKAVSQTRWGDAGNCLAQPVSTCEEHLLGLGLPEARSPNSEQNSSDASDPGELRGQSGCHWATWNLSSEKRSGEPRESLLRDAVMLAEVSFKSLSEREGKCRAPNCPTPQVGLSILCRHQHLYGAHLLKGASFLL